MNRRTLLIAGSAAPFAAALGSRAPASDRRGPAVPIADMHAHHFFVGPNPAARRPLGAFMAAGGATLVAWSLVGDMPWLGRGLKGLVQKGAPAPGDATAWFRGEMARVKAHLAGQKLGAALTPADVDRALAGEPSVVLAVEGASFLDDGIAGLEAAHAEGVRHLQLVHYVRNAVGDFQTERPEHGGLTELGRQTVAECNRLGILIDLAHATEAGVEQALAASKAPMVWSHGSVTRSKPTWKQAAVSARRLPLDTARAITAKGGVVGLWGLASDIGGTVDGYAAKIMEMAGWLGPEHVAFGSDIGALAGSPVATFADLRRVVDHLARRGVSDADLHAIAIGNYARVLGQAMAGAKA